MKENSSSSAFFDILKDLLSKNKLLILLFFLLLITAFLTVWFTYSTRLLIIEKNQLIVQRQALENEVINLKLEETIFSDKTRIENFAKQKLNMQQINPKKEVLVYE